MHPESVLSLRDNDSRLARVPYSDRIAPVSWLASRYYRLSGWRGCPALSGWFRPSWWALRNNVPQVGERIELAWNGTSQLVSAEL